MSSDEELVSFRLIPENYHLLEIEGIYKIEYTLLNTSSKTEIIVSILEIIMSKDKKYYDGELTLRVISYHSIIVSSVMKIGNTIRWSLHDDGELFTRLA